MVQKDICEKLLFRKENIFRQSFERANLSYSVFNIDSKLNKLLDILKSSGNQYRLLQEQKKHKRSCSTAAA